MFSDFDFYNKNAKMKHVYFTANAHMISSNNESSNKLILNSEKKKYCGKSQVIMNVSG